MHRPATSAVALVLLVVVVLSGTRADAETFGESIAVTEVEIPVTVLRDGEPVRGLTRDDFVVTADGARREVVGFRVVDLSGTEGVEPTQPDEPDGMGKRVQERSEGRQILVLVDLVFSRGAHIRRAVEGIETMVDEQLSPADRVAVAYLTASGGRLLLGFTSDREAIHSALGVLAAGLRHQPDAVRESLGRLARAETPDRTGTTASFLNDRLGPTASLAVLSGSQTGTLPTIAGLYGPGGATAGAIFGDGETHDDDPVLAAVVPTDPYQIGVALGAAAYTSAVRNHALEIERLVTLLRDIPSPKQVLFLSEGFGNGSLRSFDDSERGLILGLLDDISEALRRTGWTLHAIDVGGIPDAFSGEGFASDSLLRLAEQTGGLLLENYNRTERATAKLVHRTSVTYLLTIDPGELPPDGRLHPLEVRLARELRGVELHHRAGFYAPKPAAARSALERHLDSVELVLGQEEIHELNARVLARTLPVSDRLIAVPVVVELPASELAGALTLPSGAPRSGRLGLEVQVYAIDADGGVRDLWLRRLGLDLDDVGDVLARGGFRILGGLELPPGAYRLRVLVRETPDGRTSLSTVPLTVSQPAAGSLLAMDPVLVERSGDWVALAALPDETASVTGRALALDPTGERPLVPSVVPSVRSGEALDLLVVASEPAPEEVMVRVMAGDGRVLGEAPLRSLPVSTPAAVPGELDPGAEAMASPPPERLSRYVGRIRTAGLAPGSYGLVVRASASGGAVTELRSVSFEVRER